MMSARRKIRDIEDEITNGLSGEEANWLIGYMKGRVDNIARTEGEPSSVTDEQRLVVMQMLLENKEGLQEKAKKWSEGLIDFSKKLGEVT